MGFNSCKWQILGGGGYVALRPEGWTGRRNPILTFGQNVPFYMVNLYYILRKIIDISCMCITRSLSDIHNIHINNYHVWIIQTLYIQRFFFCFYLFICWLCCCWLIFMRSMFINMTASLTTWYDKEMSIPLAADTYKLPTNPSPTPFSILPKVHIRLKLSWWYVGHVRVSTLPPPPPPPPTTTKKI